MREQMPRRNLRKVCTIEERFGRRWQITAFEALSLAVDEEELPTRIGPGEAVPMGADGQGDMMQRTKRVTMAGIGVALMCAAAPAVAGEAPWMAPAAEKTKANPVARDAGVRDGKAKFNINCRLCHGPSGKGDGPAAGALNPKPRDLTSQEVQAEADGELFWKITTGRGAMPSWQQIPEKDRWSLVHYIRSLGGQK
jgi:mono/diheme cytochrome c family protein